MASFTIDVVLGRYTESGGTYTLGTVDFQASSFSISEVGGGSDSTFIDNELLQSSGFFSDDVFFRGSIAFGGETFLIFQPNGETNFYLASGSSGVVQGDFPTSFTDGDISNGNVLFCFGAGTQIATPEGPRAVEALAIGDLVVTETGTTVPVKWIGRQTIHTLFGGDTAAPVRIRAGALGRGVPDTDLIVTGDHGMVIDGMVINASALVNHGTIDFVPLAELEDTFTVYHIETERHDVILANGAPSETFIDMAGRKAFDNYQEYLDLYGADRIIQEIAMPRIASRRLVPQAIKDRLNGAPTDLRAVG
ncbi:MAG: Hint domain-containing protein [Pseudomonadota bacterium]